MPLLKLESLNHYQSNTIRKLSTIAVIRGVRACCAMLQLNYHLILYNYWLQGQRLII